MQTICVIVIIYRARWALTTPGCLIYSPACARVTLRCNIHCKLSAFAKLIRSSSLPIPQ